MGLQGFVWPERYESAAAKADSGGFNLVILVSLTVVSTFFCISVTLVGLCCRLPNWLAWSSVLFNFLSGCMGGLGTVLFIMATADIRDMLKADSVVAQTAPEMAMGWSVYVSFAG